MLGKVSLLAIVACGLLAATVLAEPAPFTDCTEKEIESRNLSVDVSQCNSTVACPLYRGSSHNFTVRFIPTSDSTTGIERIIYATFPGRRTIEIPYGRAQDSMNTTSRDSDGQRVFSVGLKEGEAYTHNNIFPVMSTAPATSLSVRYIIREKAVGRISRRVSWMNHPGKVYACFSIPVQLV